MLGRYRIDELIGAGGMGEVYRAHDTRLARDVAIKVLPGRVASDSDRLQRFRREARSLARLAHPNILEIWDFGADGGTVFAVTELLRGASLRQRIPESGMSWSKVVDLGAQIADGLAAAHSEGVIHRDLKPENVIVTDDGRVKILDFGLARLDEKIDKEGETRSLTPSATRDGTVLGTVGYMAPEQVRGEGTDARSDIFSLGCVLYEMVTGRGPFARDTTPDSMAAILREDPEPLIASASATPQDLDRTIRRCLEKSPQARFQSAADLAFALRSIGDRSSAPAAPGGGAGRRRIGLRAVATAVLAGLALLAALVLVPKAGLRLAEPPKAEIRSIAVLPFDNMSGEPDQEYFAIGMTEALIGDLARISALRVISRQSVERFKDSDTPLPEIAAALGVDAVVEGSVLRAGNTVRIATQLIRADPEENIWGDRYEGSVEDILGLQTEVARRIARAIEIEVTAREEALLAGARRVDPTAHELYLRARYLASRGGRLRESIELFEKAIAADPDYAQPYAGLAEQEVFVLPSRDHMPLARASATRALELDETLPEAHAALAMVRFYYDWDWSAAEEGFLRAIELGPASAAAHHSYSYYLQAMGRFDEARRELRVAQLLDPLNAYVGVDLARTFYYEREYDLAAAGLDSVLATTPDFSWALLVRGFVYERQGRFDEAAASIVAGRRLGGEAAMAAQLEAGFEAGGYPGFLDALLDWLQTGTSQPTSVAMVHARVGHVDAAFEWLERGFEDRTRAMVSLAIEPQFDPLRSDPRFAALLRRMKFPGH
jgi:TolB-like protein/Tfp pilus assembly protein PilF